MATHSLLTLILLTVNLYQLDIPYYVSCNLKVKMIFYVFILSLYSSISVSVCVYLFSCQLYSELACVYDLPRVCVSQAIRKQRGTQHPTSEWLPIRCTEGWCELLGRGRDGRDYGTHMGGGGGGEIVEGCVLGRTRTGGETE